MISMKRVSVIAIAATLLASCGPSSNLNRIMFKGNSEDSAYEAMLAKARAHYDRGEFNDAIDLAEKASKLSPESDAAPILIGYSYLSLAGLDPFKIAQKLIKQNESEKSDTTTASSKLTAETSSTSSTGTGDTLKKLGSVLIDVNETDYETLGTKSSSAISVFSSEPTKYDLLIPKKPGSLEQTDSPRFQISALQSINKAIAAICPFVDNSSTVKRDDDTRHKCTPTSGVRLSSAKSHYLWAISHLSEALFFSSILLYSGDPAATSTNLLNRVTALSDTSKFSTSSVNGISSFVSASVEITSNVGQIFDSSTDSMLSAILSDLNTAVGGFGAIPGMPTSITSKIQSALDSVTSAADKISSTIPSTGNASSDKTTAQLTALKGQLNSQVASTMKTQIDDLYKKNPEKFTGTDQCDLCVAYSTLSEGNPSASTPTGCSGVNTKTCTKGSTKLTDFENSY